MLLIDGFNKLYNNIAASYIKVGNESMSAINFRTTANGGGFLLVLYFPQAGTNGDRVQDCGLFCYCVLDIHIYRERGS